ncbi:hypothetical protein KFK09_004891 [Dendrobium nobile]|uniref:Uncharacterized protein n=1 Tax=Dendrobium nobile TaxID=94219 RepID=A0A8T3BWP9_DENNO|nr:hypothetical protein KFK09_004891 [Dendrobium nobile]
MARAAVINNLELPDDYDVLSVDLDEEPSDDICSISEGEGVNSLMHIRHALEDVSDEFVMMLNEDLGWRYKVTLTTE